MFKKNATIIEDLNTPYYGTGNKEKSQCGFKQKTVAVIQH
jgi:hypothetical protein